MSEKDSILQKEDIFEAKEKDNQLNGKVTPILAFTTFVTTVFGSVQGGWNTGVMTAAAETIQDFYRESYARYGTLSEIGLVWLWSVTVSIVIFGAIIGAGIASKLLDILGRKGCLLFLNVFSICGALMMGLSKLSGKFEILIVGRFIIGIYGGSMMPTISIYLTEIAPKNLRGEIVLFHRLLFVFGILLSQVFGIYILDGESDWPILLSLTGVPSVIMIIVLPFCPESPRWLLIKMGREAKGERVLKELRQNSDVSAEIENMFKESEKESKEPKISIGGLFTNEHYRHPLTISIAIYSFAQLSGIGAIFFYAVEIFELLGFETYLLNIAVVLSGLINLIGSLIAVFIVDRAGRRPLLLWTYAAMSVLMAFLTAFINVAESSDLNIWKYVSLICLYLFILFFALGPGAVPRVLVPELWSQGPRPIATSFSIAVNLFCSFIVGLIFPFLEKSIGGYTFLIFMTFSFVATVFVYFRVPETKNKTFEEIISMFKVGLVETTEQIEEKSDTRF